MCVGCWDILVWLEIEFDLVVSCVLRSSLYSFQHRELKRNGLFWTRHAVRLYRGNSVLELTPILTFPNQVLWANVWRDSSPEGKATRARRWCLHTYEEISRMSNMDVTKSGHYTTKKEICISAIFTDILMSQMEL